MKKFISGLLLAVGVSGNSFAKINVDKDQKLESSNCYHQTVTIYKDTCGRVVGQTFSPVVQVACTSIQDNNSMSQTFVIVVVPAEKSCDRPTLHI